MKSKFSSIKSLKFTRLDNILRYQHKPDGTGKIESTFWELIDLSMGQSVNIQSELREGGTVYTIGANLRLKSFVNIPFPIVLLAEFCEDGTYIIGTPYIPVKPEINNTITSKRLVFNHETCVFPLIYSL